ncbi:MAG: DUF433 domain-containing protein [Thermomicrobiales bacterium]
MRTIQRNLRDRITVDPSILVGKPIVKGTRISVELVLDRLAAEPDLDVLLEDYPHLTVDDVRACLAYASAVIAGEEIHFLFPEDDAYSPT